MTDIHIPAEALEAGKIAVAKAVINGEDGLVAAFNAIINAWPGAVKSKHYSGQGRPGIPCLSLPLPLTEPSNDKA